MFRFLLFFFFLCVSAQFGGTEGPCSATPLPPPYTSSINVVGVLQNADSYSGCLSSSMPTLWYLITPQVGSTVTLSTCSSDTNIDTVLSVYSGSCNNLTCVLFNDDSCSINHLLSSLTFKSNGEDLYVGVSSYSGSSGQFVLYISETGGPYQGCPAAQLIEGPYDVPVTIYGSNLQAARFGDSDCSLSSENLANWYQIQPTAGVAITISTCGMRTDFDTSLVVYSGSTCSTLTCFAHNDDNCTFVDNQTASTLSFTPTETNYYLVVSGYRNSAGNYQLTISQAPQLCTTSIQITVGVKPQNYLGSNQYGVLLSLDPCNQTGVLGNPSNWYKLEIPATVRNINATTCNQVTEIDSVILVYSKPSNIQDCAALSCVTYSNDANCPYNNNLSTITFRVSSDTDYYVVVTGYNGDVGTYELTITSF